MRIQSEFKSASFEFTTHGDSEWISGTFFDGSGSGIILDIFGPAHDVEAVELTFFNRDCPDQTDSSNHVTLWDGSNYKRAA